MTVVIASTPVPLFGGQPIFGDFDSFSEPQALLSTAADIDAYLGLTPGTTIYGPDPGGQCFPVQGQFLGNTSDSVTAQLAVMQGQIGNVAFYRRPTFERFPATIWPEPNCTFNASDLAVNSMGIQRVGNQYSLTYRLVIRQVPGR